MARHSTSPGKELPTSAPCWKPCARRLNWQPGAGSGAPGTGVFRAVDCGRLPPAAHILQPHASMSNKVTRRHEDLVAALQSGGRGSESLSRHLGVSLVTLRRDLIQLEAEGRLVRTFGGAVPVGGHEPELSLVQRKHLHREYKEAIARTAAALIRPGETIILDGGTTTGALAEKLRGRRD